jgi:hypothetical protein
MSRDTAFNIFRWWLERGVPISLVIVRFILWVHGFQAEQRCQNGTGLTCSDFWSRRKLLLRRY